MSDERDTHESHVDPFSGQSVSGHVAPLRLSRKAQLAAEPAVTRLIELALGQEDLISFAPGLVDEETLPDADTELACRAVLGNKELARRALQYGTTSGLPGLRRALAAYLTELDARAGVSHEFDPDRIVVGTGSQQLLYLLTQVLVDPGDIVITSAPDYFVYMATLEGAGATMWGVPLDEHGIVPQALEQLFRQLDHEGVLERVRLVYNVSYFHNPTGVTLSLKRRRELLEIVRRWSRKHRILIVEDAAYRELADEPEELPPSLAGLDETDSFVALCQTFSKPYAPGLKCGYAYLPEDLVEAVVCEKTNHDFGSPNLIQHVMLELMERGAYARQVERLRKHYAAKRSILLRALAEARRKLNLPFRWTEPRGGLYVWIVLPEGIRTDSESALFRTAIKHGVLYVPGEYCFLGIRMLNPNTPLGNASNTIRFAYGHCPLDRIEEGVQRFARALADVAP